MTVEAQAHLATIRDPIALAHSAIGNRQVDDRDECVSFLLEHLVVMAQTFQPNGWTFDDYAAHVLKLRVIDYIRTTQGRTIWSFSTHTHRRDLPIVLSLDGALTPTSVNGGRNRLNTERSGQDTEHRRLGDTIPGSEMDPATHPRTESLQRALTSTDSRPPPYIQTERETSTRRTQSRDRRAA